MLTGITFATQTFAIATRIYLGEIQVPFTVTIDRLFYVVGGAQNGNIRMGLFRDNGDDPSGGVLVVESASVAQGVVNQQQVVAVADTLLTPGRYWVALQTDDGAATFMRYFDGTGATARLYTRGGAYGPFENPCPAAALDSVLICCGARVKSV